MLLYTCIVRHIHQFIYIHIYTCLYISTCISVYIYLHVHFSKLRKTAGVPHKRYGLPFSRFCFHWIIGIPSLSSLARLDFELNNQQKSNTMSTLSVKTLPHISSPLTHSTKFSLLRPKRKSNIGLHLQQQPLNMYYE